MANNTIGQNMKRSLLPEAFLAIILLAGCAHRQATAVGLAPSAPARFVRSDAFDFAKILPAPPQPGTLAAVADLEVVLEVQAWRTPEQAAWAKRSDVGDLFDFAEVLGDWFKQERIPVTAALLKGVDAELDAGIDASKKVFGRPRPGAELADHRPGVEPGQAGQVGRDVLGVRGTRRAPHRRRVGVYVQVHSV